MKVSGIVIYLLLLYSDENLLKRGNSSLDEWTQLFSQLQMTTNFIFKGQNINKKKRKVFRIA